MDCSLVLKKLRLKRKIFSKTDSVYTELWCCAPPPPPPASKLRYDLVCTGVFMGMRGQAFGMVIIPRKYEMHH